MLAILLLAAICFCTIKYKAYIKKNDEGFYYQIRVTWFFGIIRISLNEHSGLILRPKWLFNLIIKLLTKEKPPKKNQKAKGQEEEYPPPKKSLIARIKSIDWHKYIELVQSGQLAMLKPIIKALSPKKLALTLRYGSSDPTQTGLTLAFAYIAAIFFTTGANIIANFEKEEELAIEIDTYGRFRPITIILPAANFISKTKLFERGEDANDNRV